jgi:hypothetical protein
MTNTDSNGFALNTDVKLRRTLSSLCKGKGEPSLHYAQGIHSHCYAGITPLPLFVRRQSKARAATSLITASFSLTNALFLPMNNSDPKTPLANRTILFEPTNRTKLSLVFSSRRQLYTNYLDLYTILYLSTNYTKTLTLITLELSYMKDIYVGYSVSHQGYRI